MSDGGPSGRGTRAPGARSTRGVTARGLVVALVAAAACTTAKPVIVDFAPPAHAYLGQQYTEVYERWTRHEKVIHDVESALEVWATYKSQDFREAFVAHYAEAYALPDAEREHLRATQRDAAGLSYEFVMTAQSANYRWNDIEKKTSPWRVTLIDGAGHEISPDVLKVERLPDIFEREFYPAKTPFTKTYTVRFTRSPERDEEFRGERTGKLILRVAGPLGHAELVWQAS